MILYHIPIAAVSSGIVSFSPPSYICSIYSAHSYNLTYDKVRL